MSIVKGKKVRVITSETLKSLVPDERIMKKVLDIFVTEGRLVRDAAGKRTLQVKSHLKPAQVLSRAYCFLPKQKTSDNQANS